MKRLLAILAVFISLTTFASPWDIKPIKQESNTTWDKPFGKPAFTDPYVTNYGAYVIGTFNAPNYAVNIQITFNQTVGVPYYATVQVFGDWNFDGANNGASYREFTILFSGAQHYKSVNFPMAPSEEAYTTVMDLLDYGPQ